MEEYKGVPRNVFYGMILDDEQVAFVEAIKDQSKVIVIGHTGQIDIQGKSGFAKYIEHFLGQEKCAVCKLTTNHRGWLSTYADMLEG